MKWFRPAGLLLVALLPILVPSPYFRTLLILMGIYALMAIGLDLMMGYAGIVSFGHAAFFGIGAYTASILTERFGWSLMATLPAAIIVSGLCSLCLGLATIRIGGIYFSLASLGFAEIVRLVALNWTALTHGPMGVVLAPEHLMLVGSIPLTGDLLYYYLILGTVVIAVLLIARLRDSWVGRGLFSIRENEPLASSVGIRPVPLKLAAVAGGGILAAIAGVYYGYYYSLVTPSVAEVHYTAIALLMVMVGGRGTLAGPLLGAGIFALVPELIRVAGSMRDLVFGAVLLVVVLLAPEGLAPMFVRLLQGNRRKGVGPHGTGGRGADEGIRRASSS